MWILHEGCGVFDTTLKEWTYSDLQDDNKEGFNHTSEDQVVGQALQTNIGLLYYQNNLRKLI